MSNFKYITMPVALVSAGLFVKWILDAPLTDQLVLNDYDESKVLIFVVGDTGGSFTGGDFGGIPCDADRYGFKQVTIQNFLRAIINYDDPYSHIRYEYLKRKHRLLTYFEHGENALHAFAFKTKLGDTFVLSSLPSEEDILNTFETKSTHTSMGIIEKDGDLFLRKYSRVGDHCDYPISFYYTSLRDVKDIRSYVPIKLLA